MAVRVWDAGGGDGKWSTAANWDGDIGIAAGDDLVFPVGPTGAVNNDLAANTRFNTILVQGTGYNITGNAIELFGGLTANNVSGANTFGLNTTLVNAQTVMVANTSATLTWTGSIDTANLVGNYFFGTMPALVLDGGGTLNVTGVISGAGSVSKMGFGTAILGGNNTYEGVTEARQGFLRVTHNNGLGSSSTGHTEIQAGAALELSGVTTAESFAIREGGVGFGNGTDISTAGALRGVGGATSTISGNVELVGGNNLIGVAAGSTLNISGQVLSPLSAGNRRLLKVGPGTLQFTGTQPNVYTGDTQVLQGTLELGKSGAGLDKAVPSTLIIGDNIGGDNAARVRLLGSNQIAQINLFDAAVNAVTLNSSGVLDLNNNNDTVGTLTLTVGTTYSSDITTGAGILTLGGNVTVNAFQGSSGASPAATIAGKLDMGVFYSGGASGTGTGGTRTFTINDTQNPNIATDLDISANISGVSSVSFMRVGGGTLRLGGTNTFAGPFIWNNGIIEVNSNSAFGGGLFSWQNDGGNTLRAVGGARTITNDISIDANNTNFIGTDTLTLSGNVTLTGDRTLRVMDAAQSVIISGSIGEGLFGSRNLNKGGRGTLALTGTNTYSGVTTINQDGGTLALRGSGSILNSSSVTVGVGGIFRIDNNSGGNLADRVNDAAGVNLSGKIHFIGASGANSAEYIGTISTNGSIAHTIEVENTSAGTFNSLLTASALTTGTDRTVQFIGTGVALSESGPNRFSAANNPGGLDDQILPMAIVRGPGNTIDFATYGSSTEGFAIIPLPAGAYVTDLSQAGPTSNVRLSANAVLTSSKNVNAILLDNGASITGAGATLSINANRLVFANGGSIGVTEFNPNNGMIDVVAGTATISSQIYNGTIQKGGRGTLALSGDNTFTGASNVNEGIIEVQSNNALGSPAGTTTVRQGATLQTIGGLVVGVEPVTAVGTGFSPNAPGSGLDSYASAIGAFRHISGNTSWAGNISLGSDILDFSSISGGLTVLNSTLPIFTVNAGTFTLTGDFGGDDDMVKRGAGTLELAGVVSRNQDRNNRILEGTVLLNNDPGINTQRGRWFVGSDAPGAAAAVLKLGASDQIMDDRRVEVFASGLFDLNGQTEIIGEADLILHIGTTNAADVTIGAGGMLTINSGITVQLVGVGNAVGSTITGGTLGLQMQGVIAGAGTRTWQVNDGSSGDDLTVTSTVVDGTGLQSIGLVKSGFGELVLGGTTANVITGDTSINEGTLILDKGSGAGGVNALTGRIFVGDNNITNGFSGSDALVWRQSNQLPDLLAPIDIRTTGMLNLAGKNETIGLADAQNALTLRASSWVDLGGGTLTINGNINTNAAEGASIWTPVVGTRIINGTLALGSLVRGLDVPDRGELPYEMEISANLTGSGGINFTSSGTLLLSGNNSGFSGDTMRANGNFAVGSDTAFGTGRVFANDAHISTYNGKRTIPNQVFFYNTPKFIGGNNTGGSGALGGGGNDLVFTGPVNVANGNWFPSVAVAGQVEFAGGVGETYGSTFTRKQGFGTMIISSPYTLSGGVEIGQDAGGGPAFTRLNGGSLVLRGNGSLLNSNILIGYGGVLQVDNSGTVLPHRVGDNAIIDLAGGTLALVGKAGVAVSEQLGQLRLRNNSATSFVQSLVPAVAGSSATWRFTDITRETVSAGSSVQFVGRGTDLNGSGANRLGFNAMPALTDGIVPFAVLAGSGGFDFATVANSTPSTTPFDNFLGALTSGPNFATSLAAATATVNVKLAASEVVGGAVTANALLLPNGSLAVSGGGSLTLDSGLLLSNGTGNQVSVAGLTLGSTDGIIYVNGAGSTLDVSSAIGGASSSLATAGLGRTILSGPNTFTGTTRITSGVARAVNNLAFGTTAGNVTTTYGSTLEMAGANIAAEQLDVSGTGDANLGSVGLRTVPGSGTSTWNGNVTLQISGINRNAIEVATGTALVLTGAGVVSGQGLSKTGGGTLQLGGTAANTFGGGGLLIWQGKVELAKSGVNAVATNITVGDSVGGSGSDALTLLASNQIADGNTVTVSSSGGFDYAALSDTINNFSVQAGYVSSGFITGSTGTLTINANSSIDTMPGTGGGAGGQAIIAGNLALGGTAPRIITVNDTFAVNDLMLSAVLSGVNFQKDGAGRVTLAANNSAYAGAITLNGGETVIQNANALGSAAGNTTINDNISLLIDGSFTLAEPIARLNTAGFGGQGALRQISGSSVLTGGIVLAGTATIGVGNYGPTGSAVTMDVNSAISGGANGLTKIQPGTLIFSGNSANTYTGTTSLFEGTLRLNKGTGAGGVDAIAGPLTIGNDAGAQDSDLLILDQDNQINNGVQVQVTPSGRLDLNGKNETIGQAAATGLNLFLGVTTGPNITTGAGTLSLGNGLGVQTQMAGGLPGGGNPFFGVVTTQSPAAKISGKLALLGNTTFNLIDAGIFVRELQIDADITGTAGLTRSNTGALYLGGNNAGLTGGFTLNANGAIIAGSNTAFGANTLTVSTAGATGGIATTIIVSDFTGGSPATITLPNSIVMNNNSAAQPVTVNVRGDDNVDFSGTITNASNNNTLNINMQKDVTATLSGTINLSNDATNRTLTINNSTFGGGVNNTIVGGTVLISGLVANGGGSTASLLTKGGNGLMVLSNNANSYTGTTTVAGGNLRVTSNGALGGSVSEVQTFAVTSTGGGSFTISFGANNPQTTTALNFSGVTPPSITDVQNALNALLVVGGLGGSVSVASSNPAGPTTTYTLTFNGALAGVNVGQVTVAPTAPVTVSTAPATTVAGTGGTTVNSGATLQVEPGLNLLEHLRVNGTGFGNFGSLRLRDVTANTTETATISSFLMLDQSGTVGVDAGGANPDRIITSGGVISGNQTIKIGAGEWEVSGTADNFQNPSADIGTNGWDDGIDLRNGTVILNKTGTLRGISNGTVTIGDGGGGDNADRLILVGSGTDELGNNLSITIGASGQFSMSGSKVSEAIGSATMQRIGSYAGDINTGTASLIMNGDIVASNAAATTAATAAATVNGFVNLNGSRNLTANDSYVFNAADDLVINALLSNGTVNTNAFGTVLLTNPGNSYAGGTNVNSATLDFNASYPNGLAFLVGGTLRTTGSLSTGNVAVNAGANLTLDNTAGNQNFIADTATLTVAGGRVNLIGNAAGSTETIATLTINAGDNAGTNSRVNIDSSAGGVTILQAGAMTRGGQGSAEFIGTGADLGSATNSRIQINGGTNPFVNSVLPWAIMTGPAGVDLVTDADGTAGSAPFFLGRVTTYSSSVNAGGIVRLTGGVDTLTADRTVDALLLEGGATVTGPFTLTVGTATSGLIFARTGTNTISAAGSVATNPGLQFNGIEAQLMVETGASLNVSGTINGTGTLRKERGGTLTLSGDNDNGVGVQYTGAININAGTVIATNEDALGSEPGGTVSVNRRAALVLDSTAAALNFGNKALAISGLGVNDDGTGALRSIGANTITVGTGATAVNWNTSPTVVSVGTGNTLTLNATIGGGGNPLIKRGAGELIYSGSADNGNTQPVSVNAGKLTLNKTGTNRSIRGALTIDDLSNYDDIGGGIVQYGAGGSTNQIDDGVSIVINAPGSLDLAGVSDTISALTINGGTVTTGAGTLTVNGALTITGGLFNGNLVLNNNLTYNSGISTGGIATINGTINLGGATRTFTVNDGILASDLIIDAALSNGRLVKGGNGGLLLNNATNSFLTGINEVQRIVVAGATAGTSTFNINYNGNTTATITVDAVDATTAAAIDAALEALPNVGAGGVNVTVTAARQFDIEFTGNLAAQDIPNQITVNVVVAGGASYSPSTVTTGVAGINHTAGILGIGNNAALGTARIQVGNAQVIAVGGDRTVANSFALSNNITTVWGGRRDFGGTNDLTITGGITLHSSVNTAQVVNLDVLDPLTLVTWSGVISGGGNFIVPTKRGVGTMVWSGNNTLDVRDTVTGSSGGTGQTDGFRVENGVLRLAHSNALGTSGTANIHVRSDYLNGAGLGMAAAALELDGTAGDINLPANRNIVLLYQDNFFSYGRFGSATGVLRSVAGNNTVAGTLDLRNINDNDNQGRIYVGVDAGSLSISGTIFGTRNNAASDIRNNREILKVGAGTLELSGSNVNNISGNFGVLEGALRLIKAAGVPAISGPLFVGDNVGAANSDSVILSSAEQILDTSAVTVTGSGVLQTNAAQAASLTNEVQQIQVGNAAPAGQFRLQFNGQTTADIAFGATLSSIQSALNALSTIGGAGGSVAVYGSGSGQNQSFSVVFLGSLAGANQPTLKVLAGTTAFSGAAVVVTTITQGGQAGRETIGATTLRAAPQGTGSIALNANSTLALTGDVTVDNYGALPAAAVGATITGGTIDLRQQSATGNAANRTFTTVDLPAVDDLTITSRLAEGAQGSVSNLNKAGGANSRLVLNSATANTFTGTATVSNGNLAIQAADALGTIFTEEVQSYIINNTLGAAGGSYTITTDAGTTVPLSPNATAEEVQAALATLYGAGNVQVLSAISGNTGTQYFIRWSANAASTFQLLSFTPTSTGSQTTAISYADATALDTANGAAAGNTNFEGLWTGSVTVAPADPLTWSFGTNSDDGSVLLVDFNNDGKFTANERVVNNNGSHGTQLVAGTVTFPAAGTYKIAIGFFQGTGGGLLDARFAKAAGVAFADQTIINPGDPAQAGMWSDDSAVANSLTVKWYNRTPAAAAGLSIGPDLEFVINPISITNSTLTTASAGAVTTHQDGWLGASTTVNGGAALELRGGAGMTIVNEPLVLNGTGIINAPVSAIFNNSVVAFPGTGALRNVTGANVWQSSLSGFGNIAINNNPTAVGVDGGSLVFSGPTSTITGGGSLLKTGPGSLELGGNTGNLYTGNTYVHEGTLILNKATNSIAILGGEVFIGDARSADNSDILFYASGSGGNQIANQVVRIGGSGVLNLNGNADVFSTPFLDAGANVSADFITGSGTYVTNNTITAVANAARTAASPSALITGTISLNNVNRTFDVRRGSGSAELDVQASIVGGGATGAINKIGQGTLRLSGNNSYDGTTTVATGVLQAGSSGALGTTTGLTTVASFAALELNGAAPLSLSESVQIFGDGYGGTRSGVVRNIGPSNVNLSGPVAAVGISTDGSVTIGNDIAGTTVDLTGVLSFAGNQIFTGAGNINVASDFSTPQFSGLEGRIFLATALGINNTNINNVIPGGATVPAQIAGLPFALDFPQDSDAKFTSFFGGIPGATAFTATFTGTVTIPTTGTYYFAVTNNDDLATLWIDSSGNNSFEAPEMVRSVGCCNNTGFATVNLNAGTYKIAWAVEDTGGGSGLTGRFQPGTAGVPSLGTNMPLVFGMPLSVTKNGTGTLNLQGSNVYTLGTTVNQGTLLANNFSGSATGTGPLVVKSGATFGGDGSVASVVTVETGGNIDPGTNGAGDVGTGDLVLNSGANYNVQINAPFAGTGGYDQIDVTGSVTLNNALLNLTWNLFNAPTQGTSFVLIDNDFTFDSILGSGFSNALNSSTFTHVFPDTKERLFTVNYFGGDGNDLVLATTNRLPTGAIDPVLPILEGGILALNATASDLDSDSITYSWDLNNDGNFSDAFGASATVAWSSLQSLVPAINDNGTYNATLRVNDGFGNLDLPFTFVVNNAAPQASLNNGGPVNEGSTGNVNFTGAFDFSQADLTAGLRYSYDFNNDGTWDVGDGSYAFSVTAASQTIPASYFADGPSSLTVKARILDKDGGLNDYTTVLTILNVNPTATVPASASVNEHTAYTFTATSPFDPSPVDTTAGVHYSFDLDGNGLFDDGLGDGASYAGSITAASQTLSATTLDDGPQSRTLRVRVFDKDGGMTEYVQVLSVLNVAPTATVPAAGSVNEHTTFTINVTGSADVSTADTTAGFRYAYDLNADGLFNDGFGDGTYGGSILTTSVVVPVTTLDDGFTGASKTIKTRIIDKDGGVNEYNTVISIANVNPTATTPPAATATVNEHSTFTLTFAGATDPSTADTTAGFHYAFDLNGDGLFNDGAGNGTYAGSGTSATAIVPATALDDGFTGATKTFTTRIIDKDGGSTDYTTVITINNVNPTATPLPATATVNEHTAYTISVLGATDPSTLDAASLHFAFDLNGSGVYGDFPGEGTGLYAGSGTSATAIVPATVLDDGFAGATKTVRARVMDKDGGTTEYTTVISITNVAPVASISGTNQTVPGVPTDYDIGATDPSTADMAAGFTYTINWGDGTQTTPPGQPSLTTITHIYSTFGTFVIKVTAKDKDGAVSAQATQTVTVTPVAQNPLTGDIIVGGTNQVDRIIFSPSNGSVQVSYKAGSAAAQVYRFGGGSLNPDSKLIAYGQGGSDTIEVSGNLPYSAEFHGGLGNDTLTGLNGNDTLFGDDGNDNVRGGNGNDLLEGNAGNDKMDGGAGDDMMYGGVGTDSMTGGVGNDTLFGGDNNDSVAGVDGDDILYGDGANDFLGVTAIGVEAADTLGGGNGADVLVGNGGTDTLNGNGGNDILIGGMHKDILNGGNEEDVLLGGTSDYDDGTNPANIEALYYLLQEWAYGGGTYLDRIDNLINGGGLTTGYTLDPGSTANTNDLTLDSLTGGTAQDWFLSRPNDRTDRKPDETVSS